MTRSLHPFLSAMLCQLSVALLIVMSTAFVTIPQAVGGHPGEIRSIVATAAVPHLS